MFEELKIEKFKDIGIIEDTLCFKSFVENDTDKEISLSACFEPYKDSAWYQINIGEYSGGQYKDLEEHRFYSLKKAIKWWNDFFIKIEGDISND